MLSVFFSLLILVSLQEAQVFIPASQQDELTEELIMAAFAKIRPPMERLRRPSRTMDKEETVVRDCGKKYKLGCAQGLPSLKQKKPVSHYNLLICLGEVV